MFTFPLMDGRDVSFKMADLSENFVAYMTYVITLSLVNSSDVDFETASVAESFVT